MFYSLSTRESITAAILTGKWKNCGLFSGRGMRFFLFSKVSGQILGLSQPPVFPGLKRPEREAEKSPPSNAEFKNLWSYISTLTFAFQGVHRDNLTFTLQLKCPDISWAPPPPPSHPSGNNCTEKEDSPYKGSLMTFPSNKSWTCHLLVYSN